MFLSFDLCVCVRQRERKEGPHCVCVCGVCEQVCVRALCVYERKRERESELTAIVCVRASECVSDCVCVSECVWE